MLLGVDSSQRQRHAIGSPAAFRPQSKQYALHPLERTLAGLVIAILIFLPWAFGGMMLWAQWTAIGLSFTAFVASLIPRRYDERYHAGGNVRLITWPRLVRFPVFWLGLLFLAYITIQALNPAWLYMQSNQGWWMTQIDYIEWLPHGVISPFKWANPWRSFIIYTSAWMLVCALWVGITRRRTLLIILIFLSCNAVSLALYVGYQKLSGLDKIYGLVTSPNPEFLGSFYYRNHGAAWLNLMVSVAFALAAWYQLRDLKRMAKSSPATFFAFLALIVSVMVYVSNSRGGILVLSLFILLFSLTFTVRQLTLPPYPQRKFILGLLLVLFAVCAVQGIRRIEDGTTLKRMQSLLKGGDLSVTVREQARLATTDMWEDAPWLGHGASAFRFLFPQYQQHYPLIYTEHGRRFYWEHAHNDIVQLFAEFGVVGVSILAVILLWFIFSLLGHQAWCNPVALTLLLGIGTTTLHSWWEFVFQCPAILLSWCALWPIALRWAELDVTHRH
jgi:O-antigen ligase